MFANSNYNNGNNDSFDVDKKCLIIKFPKTSFDPPIREAAATK